MLIYDQSACKHDRDPEYGSRAPGLGQPCRSSAGPSALNLIDIPNHALPGVATFCRAFGPGKQACVLVLAKCRNFKAQRADRR